MKSNKLKVLNCNQVTAERTDEVQSSEVEEMFTDVFNNIVEAILDGFVDEAPGISHPYQSQDRTPDMNANNADQIQGKTPDMNANDADQIQDKTSDMNANDADQIQDKTPDTDANDADQIQDKTPDMDANDAAQSIRLDGTTGTWDKIC